MHHFFDFDPESLKSWCQEHGLPPFASKQMMEWVYQHGVDSADDMTNIGKKHRTTIAQHICFQRGDSLAHQLATDGTQKLLLGWRNLQEAPQETAPLAVLNESDMRQTETVMIPTENRKTACVSSQAGCPVGCKFCASGIGGLEGNLTRGQIVEQAWRLGRLKDVGRISNIVFMGMGEPLANFTPVTNAVRTLNAPWGMGIGARRITISTVGMPSSIRKLVDFEIPVTLALSLHAPNDDLRRELIPWAQYSTIEELIDACDEYFQKTGREITLEYILLGGVNDQPEHARELAVAASRLRANINLIRYNEVDALPYRRPATDDVHRFQEILRQRNVNVHIRASRGRDIAAACGQLKYARQRADS